MNEIEIRIVL